MSNYCDKHEHISETVDEIHTMVTEIRKRLFGNGEEGLCELTRRQERRWQIISRVLWGVVLAVIGIVTKMLFGVFGS